jgi:hypothetical protein
LRLKCGALALGLVRVRESKKTCELPEAWLQLGNKYVELNGGGDESVAKSWSETYRYRLIVAREFAQKVGIYSEDISNSEFVPKVVVHASTKTEEV